MAFLDNSGDIILDAVLTDEGRRRLAMGDGSFRITKFGLGDDEIDYSLYVPATSSGYEDTRILQLPVFEAFTNNTTSLKSRLVTYTDSSILHLPVIKLNAKVAPTAAGPAGPVGGYYAAVDSTTSTKINGENTNAANSAGYRYAHAGASADQSRVIFDQGLDTADLALGLLVPNDDRNAQEAGLFESQYLVEVDNRLLNLAGVQGGNAQPSFIDDDNIATYLFALGSDPQFFASQPGGRGGSIPSPAFGIIDDDAGTRTQDSEIGPTVTTGRLGTRLIFTLRSTLNLQNSQNLFTRLGGTASIEVGTGPATSFSYINTVIRITGFTTGYRVEVPIKLLKFTA